MTHKKLSENTKNNAIRTGIKIKKYVDAWWYRTLPFIDLDRGGKMIPPPTEKNWKRGVRRDLMRIIDLLF